MRRSGQVTEPAPRPQLFDDRRAVLDVDVPAILELRPHFADYDPNSWWQHRESVKIFFHELGGMFVSMWELRRTAGPPGAILELTPWMALREGTG